MVLDTHDGVWTWFSSEVSVNNCTLNVAPFPVVIENTNHMTISNLTVSAENTKIDVILSAFIVFQNIHTDRGTFVPNLKFMIGNATEVYLSNISFIKGSNLSSVQGTGGQIDISQSTTIVMSNVSFTGYTERSCYSTNVCFAQSDSTAPSDSRALHAVVSLQSSTNIVFNDCSFASNNVTALKVVDSSISLSGSVNFTNNRAIRGAAIILSQRSYITITDNATVIFEDNIAALTGGAIYLDGYRDQIGDYYGYI